MASKNTPTAIVSGAYWAANFFEKLASGLRSRGWEDERIHALVTQQGAEEMGRGIAAFVDAIAGPSVPTFDPATGTFRWEVDYDQSIAEKTAESERDSKSLAWVTDYASDAKFPDNRSGKRVVAGRIKYFNKSMGQDEIRQWAWDNNKILARPKELINFSRAFPRPALDNDMPLAAPGQFWTDADGDRRYLCLNHVDTGRGLSPEWLHPTEEWPGYWGFLVLDK